MRKLALLVAAALVVSAPVLTTSSTQSFAAAKAKAKAAPAEESRGLFSAFGDQLSGSSDAKAGKKTKRAKATKK